MLPFFAAVKHGRLRHAATVDSSAARQAPFPDSTEDFRVGLLDQKSDHWPAMP
jgi:hypothetical protein